MKNEIGHELSREMARLDQADFRHVLGHFSTGVTVVTAVSKGEPVGFTCQSFISLSLDPPLIALAPAKTSTSWPRIAKAPAFCVNILSSGQAAVGRAFAISGRKKFEGVRWRPGLTGAPVIDGTLAYVECRHWAVYEAGDHDLVMARVVAVKYSNGEPLLYFRSEFRSLA
jgi:flavin reductase (DIM6/NTAB) family NADH-FMN oxidoreductase RutF